MKCIEVKTEPSYNVWIGPALTSQIGKLLYPIASGHRVAMISDMYVDPLYGGEVMNAIKDYGIDVVSIPMMVDEKTKTLSTVESLWERSYRRISRRKTSFSRSAVDWSRISPD